MNIRTMSALRKIANKMYPGAANPLYKRADVLDSAANWLSNTTSSLYNKAGERVYNYFSGQPVKNYIAEQKRARQVSGQPWGSAGDRFKAGLYGIGSVLPGPVGTVLQGAVRGYDAMTGQSLGDTEHAEARIRDRSYNQGITRQLHESRQRIAQLQQQQSQQQQLQQQQLQRPQQPQQPQQLPAPAPDPRGNAVQPPAVQPPAVTAPNRRMHPVTRQLYDPDAAARYNASNNRMKNAYLRTFYPQQYQVQQREAQRRRQTMAGQTAYQQDLNSPHGGWDNTAWDYRASVAADNRQRSQGSRRRLAKRPRLAMDNPGVRYTFYQNVDQRVRDPNNPGQYKTVPTDTNMYPIPVAEGEYGYDTALSAVDAERKLNNYYRQALPAGVELPGAAAIQNAYAGYWGGGASMDDRLGHITYQIDRQLGQQGYNHQAYQDLNTIQRFRADWKRLQELASAQNTGQLSPEEQDELEAVARRVSLGKRRLAQLQQNRYRGY